MTDELKSLMHTDETSDLVTAIGRLREGLQELMLMSLDRSGFFDDAVFHGGRASAYSTVLTASRKILISPLGRGTTISTRNRTSRPYCLSWNSTACA